MTSGSHDDEVLRARAARLARPLEAETVERAALLVTIAAQSYAFELADVRRTSMISKITRLPHVPPIVLGLGRLEGDVVAVFDGRVWAGGSPRATLDDVPVLALSGPRPLVLAVDELNGLVSLPPGAGTLTREGVVVVDTRALLENPAFSRSGATP